MSAPDERKLQKRAGKIFPRVRNGENINENHEGRGTISPENRFIWEKQMAIYIYFIVAQHVR